MPRRKSGAEAERAGGDPIPWKGPIWEAIRHQEEALGRLRQALASGQFPHALLFWGPPGVGKTRTAQGLAQALLCRGDDPPCGTCLPCRKVARLVHPDLHLLRPLRAKEAEGEDPQLQLYATNPVASLEASPPATVGIDRIRRLKEESAMALVEGACRVIVIPQAELMTQEAANAALKLLEEPRGETFLVLTTSDPRRLLPTVVSRCRRIRFRALPQAFLQEMAEAAGADAASARLAAALSEGSLPRALELAGEGISERVDEALALVAPAPGGPAELVRRAEEASRGWDAGTPRLLAGLLALWQEDLLRVLTGAGSEGILYRERLDRLQTEAKGLDVGEVRRRLELLDEFLEALAQYVNPLLALRVFLLAWVGGGMPDRMLRG
jgi:DNA polymerase-3 subunit delta'